MKFTELPFAENLLEGIAASNYEHMTAVQEKVIPLVLQGKDVIASAQTGTGKTAAFLLPLINLIQADNNNDHHTSALIIVPTRELAVQISDHLQGLSYFTPVSSVAIYGGVDGNAFVREKQAMISGVDVIVCTPGKLIAHMNMGYVKFKQLKYLVLDEADRMLDMGFYDDIMRIVDQLPKERQNLFFSATMPPKIRALAKKILRNPVEVSISLSKPPEKIIQKAIFLEEDQKSIFISNMLKKSAYKSIVIFCSRKKNVKELTNLLKLSGHTAGEIHSDLEQLEREEILRKFTTKRLPVLVATDIVSRGIDVEHIDLVINYDVPSDPDDYVHRIGRTARAEMDGTAVTLVSNRERKKFSRIENLVGSVIIKEYLQHKKSRH